MRPGPGPDDLAGGTGLPCGSQVIGDELAWLLIFPLESSGQGPEREKVRRGWSWSRISVVWPWGVR